MGIIIYAFQDVYKKTNRSYIMQQEENTTTVKAL